MQETMLVVTAIFGKSFQDQKQYINQSRVTDRTGARI